MAMATEPGGIWEMDAAAASMAEEVQDVAAASVAASEAEARMQDVAASVAASEASEASALQFCCGICLEELRNPSATLCGHMFCWLDLFRWLSDGHSKCPMCSTPLLGGGDKPLFVFSIYENRDDKDQGTWPRPPPLCGVISEVYRERDAAIYARDAAIDAVMLICWGGWPN